MESFAKIRVDTGIEFHNHVVRFSMELVLLFELHKYVYVMGCYIFIWKEFHLNLNLIVHGMLLSLVSCGIVFLMT